MSRHDPVRQSETYINSDTGSLDPLIKAYLVHYQFEAIHPFYDGNGRIGRVLLALMISKWCDFVSPWLYMSPYFERYKDEYISNMFRVSTAGAWDAWIEFCLRGTITQAEDAIRRVEKLRELRAQMLEQIKSEASPRTHQIIESLFSNPIVRVSKLSQELNVTYPTAKDDIDRLVRAGILVHLEDIRPMAYFSPAIFAVAYNAPEDFM